MLRSAWRRYRPQPAPSLPKGKSDELLRELLELAPSAIRAQREMDKHPGAYHTNKIRLYELIDFNDTFVSLALSLSPAERVGFIDKLKGLLENYCEEHDSPMFSDEQYEAITRGLSREVAVYLGARANGYGAELTSRRQDAMGVDMVITDKASGRSINIDCKTPSAYHYRVKDLVQQGRLTNEQADMADQLGYVPEINGHGDDAVKVTLLRVDPNDLGDIHDFTFDEPRLIGQRLAELFKKLQQN